MKTLKLKPISECIAIFNVSAENRVAIYSSGALSSVEYAKAMEMLDIDRLTMLEAETEEASRRAADDAREYEPGGLEAMCRALRDAMGDHDTDWRDYCLAAGKALLAMPASAIEARRAATPQSDAVHESAGPQDDAPTVEVRP